MPVLTYQQHHLHVAMAAITLNWYHQCLYQAYADAYNVRTIAKFRNKTMMRNFVIIITGIKQ